MPGSRTTPEFPLFALLPLQLRRMDLQPCNEPRGQQPVPAGQTRLTRHRERSGTLLAQVGAFLPAEQAPNVFTDDRFLPTQGIIQGIIVHEILENGFHQVHDKPILFGGLRASMWRTWMGGGDLCPPTTEHGDLQTGLGPRRGSSKEIWTPRDSAVLPTSAPWPVGPNLSRGSSVAGGQRFRLRTGHSTAPES